MFTGVGELSEPSRISNIEQLFDNSAVDCRLSIIVPAQIRSRRSNIEHTLGPVFRAVVLTVVPPASELDDERWREVEGVVADALSTRPAALVRKLRFFLHLIQWLPLLRYGHRFTSLTPERRLRFLVRLESHPSRTIRVGFWGLRALALMGFYARPSSARSIGYLPDPAGWEAYRR